MQEVQDVFEIDFDAPPPPVLDELHPDSIQRIDFDTGDKSPPIPTNRRRQAFTLWAKSSNLSVHSPQIAESIREILEANPFTTLQVVVESGSGGKMPHAESLNQIIEACHLNPTYLDKYYSLQPGEPRGAKRIVLLVPDDCPQEFAGMPAIEVLLRCGTLASSATT